MLKKTHPLSTNLQPLPLMNAVLRPVRPNWESLLQEEKADAGFMTDREEIVLVSLTKEE